MNHVYYPENPYDGKSRRDMVLMIVATPVAFCLLICLLIRSSNDASSLG